MCRGTPGKPNNEKGRTCLDRAVWVVQVIRRESTVDRRFGKCGALDFDLCYIGLPCSIVTFTPNTFAVTVRRNRESRESCHVVRNYVQFDLETIRVVPSRFVNQQPAGPLRKTATRRARKKAPDIRQRTLLRECEDAYGGVCSKGPSIWACCLPVFIRYQMSPPPSASLTMSTQRGYKRKPY